MPLEKYKKIPSNLLAGDFFVFFLSEALFFIRSVWLLPSLCPFEGLGNPVGTGLEEAQHFQRNAAGFGGGTPKNLLKAAHKMGLRNYTNKNVGSKLAFYAIKTENKGEK